MRVVRKAYKFRIYPNRMQQAALAVQFGHARFVYNWGLSQRKRAYETIGKGLSYTQQANALKSLKAEYAWLRDADSQVLQHKLSTWMTWHYGVIAFENLHITGMVKNHRLAKSISDAGWAQFVQMCQYKGDWYGCAVEQVGRFFPSSKQCSACGSVNRGLKLSDRKWVCPDCGCVLHRDQNAAQNILHEALTGRSIRFSCGAQEYKGGADIRPQHARGASVET